MKIFAFAILLSSFLLFQIQPMIGKYILPWFGGGAGVWAICMLFFQIMLLAGYTYAHLLTMLERRKQICLHLGLLFCALLFLPVAPSPEQWKPLTGEDPSLKILLLLLLNIGVPYLILSASAPLLQHWYIRTYPGKSPYRLYALSNAGSLGALLSYPFLVEPKLALVQQMSAWAGGFVCLILLFGGCAALLWCKRTADDDAAGSLSPSVEPTTTSLSVFSLAQWLILSACGSIMLLATTNLLCQDIAAVPFLWVIPLALYLLSFIICFSCHKPGKLLLWMGGGLALAMLPASLQFTSKHDADLWIVITVYLITLFVSCMACHGALGRSRPEPCHLTVYYLVIAAGGAIGGGFVTLIAPVLFKGFWEYPFGLALSFLAVFISCYRAALMVRTPKWAFAILAICLTMFIYINLNYYVTHKGGALIITRNFFGVLKLYLEDDAVGRRMMLVHGQIRHGWQYINPDKREYKTAYYGPDSGGGLLLRFHPRRFAVDLEQRSLRVGIIGLGAGTLAAYGQPGDVFNFYEINPDVIVLANRYFSFCRNSAAQVGFVEGDGRIKLEAELKQSGPQNYDVIIVDAFNGDAIPLHLLTRECFAVYRQHLKPDGLLAVHLSNKYLDLTPAVHAQGEAAGWLPQMFTSPAVEATGIEEATWMVMMPDRRFLDKDEVSMKADRASRKRSVPVVWSDDFASLWQTLKYE